MYTIELTTTELHKNPNTKTTYFEVSKEVEIITDKTYYNITNEDTCKFFRRLGGTETKQMAYTCAGYKCYKLTSTSPNRQIKKVREFKFIENDKNI